MHSSKTAGARKDCERVLSGGGQKRVIAAVVPEMTVDSAADQSMKRTRVDSGWRAFVFSWAG